MSTQALIPVSTHAVGLAADTPSEGHATIPRYYRPELDLLRCLAFLLVFNHHLLPIAAAGTPFSLLAALAECGALGVCLFFMLSAFLITELLLREREATGTIHIRAFYVRRVLRIWPLYLLAIAIALLLPHIVHDFDYVGPLVAPYLLFSGNWAVVAHGWFHNPLLSPLWSISVEEQFYLVWPTLVLFWGGRGILRAALIILPAAWLFDYLLPALHVSRNPGIWCDSISQFQFFALGAILAVFLHGRNLELPETARFLCLGSGLALLLVSAYPLHIINMNLGTAAPFQVLTGYFSTDVACLLLFCAFLGAKVSPIYLPVLYLGRISYGLYVFHDAVRGVVSKVVAKTLVLSAPLQLTATYIVTALLSILLAMLSYQFFEKPFLRFKRRFTFVPSRVD